jgi:hypothetical protein
MGVKGEYILLTSEIQASRQLHVPTALTFQLNEFIIEINKNILTKIIPCISLNISHTEEVI